MGEQFDYGGGSRYTYGCSKDSLCQKPSKNQSSRRGYVQVWPLRFMNCRPFSAHRSTMSSASSKVGNRDPYDCPSSKPSMTTWKSLGVAAIAAVEITRTPSQMRFRRGVFILVRLKAAGGLAAAKTDHREAPPTPPFQSPFHLTAYPPPSNKTAMSMAIPPEIVDRIIDYVHDDTKGLIACSLVARDWVPSTRLHLFAKFSLLSAHKAARFTELDSFAPDILYYCQELSIGTNNKYDDPSTFGSLPLVGTLPSTISGRVERFTSLHTLHFRGFPSGLKNVLIASLVDISERITTVTFTDSNLESCYDLWKILRLFPNLENVHASDLGYSSSKEGGLAVAPSYCHSPPIVFFSLHTYCQGFVLEQLAEPPYPLTHLKSLEIHHSDQQQRHLNSIATKYQDAITTLRFSAHSTLGSGMRLCSPPPSGRRH